MASRNCCAVCAASVTLLFFHHAHTVEAMPQAPSRTQYTRSASNVMPAKVRPYMMSGTSSLMPAMSRSSMLYSMLFSLVRDYPGVYLAELAP